MEEDAACADGPVAQTVISAGGSPPVAGNHLKLGITRLLQPHVTRLQSRLHRNWRPEVRNQRWSAR